MMKPKVKVTGSGNKPVMENIVVERKPLPTEIKYDCIHVQPKSVTFGFHTADDIRKISAVQITKNGTFDRLGHTIDGGLYDLFMGPSRETDVKGNLLVCGTCVEKFNKCPGHYGHIELPLPVYHPLFLKDLIGIIKLTCPTCKRFFLLESRKALLAGQLELLEHGQLIPAQQLKELAHIKDDLDEEEEEVKPSTKSHKSKAQDQELKQGIESKVKSLLEECGALEQSEKPLPTRHVEGLRQTLINEYKKKAVLAGKCSHCEGGWKKIVLYKSRIVFSLRPGTVATGIGGNFMEAPPDMDETLVESSGPGEGVKKKSRKSASVMPTTYLTPTDARDHLREVWNNDRELFGRLFPVLKTTNCENPTDVFFLDVVPVIPPKFRPMNFSNGALKENGQSLLLKKIIQETYVVRAAIAAFKQDTTDQLPKEAQAVVKSLTGESLLDKMQTAWLGLQESVNMIADTSNHREFPGAGFKQVIEKKEGLFRMHMMGKRVNFAARSVITPDPNIDVEEIGVPEIFAKKLTFPTPVTAWNVQELRELVRNGPNVHPGALFVEEENGKMTMLSSTDARQREAAAKTLLTPTDAAIKANQGKQLSHGLSNFFKPKIVHRHLQNGDVMLLNRQPTLHKPSIMAHKARVLPGEKTLRLHYSNCKAYNADFDGDEMNAHFPQNQVARSEGYNIVAVPHQYLVPKDGTPLGGLIQDHMISGVRLSIRGKFFDRADYQQLVYAGLSKYCVGRTKLLPPAIMKPVPLWSGKQVFSTIIMNLTPKGKPLINIESTAKISLKDWQNGTARQWKAGGTPLPKDQSMTESEVIIRHGELLVGVLDKMHYGATSYGLIHSFWELYGAEFSSRLLSSLGRLFTYFLQIHGFTLGVEDILLNASAEKKRKKILSQTPKVGFEAAVRAVGLNPQDSSIKEVDPAEVKRRLGEAHLSGSTLKRMTIDHEYKMQTDKITNEVNKACMPHGLLKPFPDNNLALMIQSGAKGSSVNSMQISCLLGQIELEGKRPPLMISGRSLPSFLPYDTSPRAGGFVAGRFMTGIRPQEFFFHCMAGREGLIDTAVKTARSGYLQRCLIKHLEGVTVAYDQTVRDSDGSVLQFLYGEDGLDVCKSQYLNEKSIPFLVENRDCIRLANTDLLKQDQESQDEVKAALKQVKRWVRKRGDLNSKERKSGFLNFSTQAEIDPDQKPGEGRKIRPGRTLVAEQLEKAWRQMDEESKAAYLRRQEPPPDPVNSKYSSCRHVDVLVERLQSMVDNYMEKPDANIGRKQLTRMIYSKAVESAVAPGEPVGILAAQSIGEPSTQMTLNTFHFAGRGDMNVTLGIPRLREILMTASANIQTPSMDIPLLKKGPKGVKMAERLKLKLTRVTLADVLEKVDVTERLHLTENNRSRIYSLTFHFLPRDSYSDRFCVKPKQVLRYFEGHFVSNVLLPGIRKEAAAQSLQSLFVAKTASKRVARSAVDGGDDEEDNEAEKSMDVGAAGPTIEDENGDSDAEAGDDVGTSADRERKNKADEQEYEDEDEAEGNEDKSARAMAEYGDEGFEEYDDRNNAEEQMELEQPVADFSPEMEQAVEFRKNQMLDQDDWIADYEFDTVDELWSRVTLAVPLSVQKVDMSSSLRIWAESAIVYQVPGIKRAFVVLPKSEDDDIYLKTEGVNIQAMFKFPKILDLNRLYCNDVHQIAKHYGVEAASQVIVKEIRNVFTTYGISVDVRHLSLIASYMTSGGGYRCFNRPGMKDGSSPLQQMSFESATEFLKKAVLEGKTDYLKSPSSRLVVGLPGLEGTGSFGLLHKLY